MHLNDAGNMVQRVWNEIPSYYPNVTIDAFIVMPNHVHGIIVIGHGRTIEGQLHGATPTDPPETPTIEPDTAPREGRPLQGNRLSLPDIVQRFKTMTMKHYIEGVRESAWNRFRGRLWQRGYYEHVIRRDGELEDIRRYIYDNPLRWAVDRENRQS